MRRHPLVLIVVEDDAPPLEITDVRCAIEASGVRFTRQPGDAFEIDGGAEAGGVTVVRNDRLQWLRLRTRRGRVVGTPVSTLEALKIRLSWHVEGRFAKAA